MAVQQGIGISAILNARPSRFVVFDTVGSFLVVRGILWRGFGVSDPSDSDNAPACIPGM